MANIRYFADCQGRAVQLLRVSHDGHVKTTAEHFGGQCPTCGQRHQASRLVRYGGKNGLPPSRHECDARCTGATGRTMNCECACGGTNHGRGASLTCEAA